ncbi:MAG: SAM-dependent methyltransferase [Acidimicrobiales bacterium]
MLWHAPFSPDVAQDYLSGGRATIDLIVDRLGAARCDGGGPSTWLEIGCGYGRLVRALIERVDPGQIWALDVDRGGVDFCVAEFGVHGLYGTSDLDYRGLVRADAILAVSVVTHLDTTGSRRFFTCLGDVVTPGGGVLFTTHGPDSMQQLEHYDQGAYESHRLTLEASFARDGMAYVPYPWAAGGAYGMAWHDPAYVCRIMDEIHGDRFQLLRYEPRSLDGHQDIWIYRRSHHADDGAGSILA